MKRIFLITLTCASLQAFPQSTGVSEKHYGTNTGEIIFSGGEVKTGGVKLDNIVRFTMFFHFQHQAHFDFSQHVGLYTGIGVRNVGFINKIKSLSGEDAKLKQRSYSIGIPIALKLGNMEKHSYISLGVEAEMMFAYKEKIFYKGYKSKNHKWFSDNVNLFNPSAFFELHGKKGGFIRAKYYLLDFLKDNDQSFFLPDSSGELIPYHPSSSKLFYISIGNTIKMKKHAKKHVTKDNA